MAYFNRVTKIQERITTSTQVAQYDGSWVTEDLELEATYRCEACKLVWSRYGQAQQCAARAHRNQFMDTYYSQVTIEGRTHIVERNYPRQALRRDGPKPPVNPSSAQALAPVSRPAAPASSPALTLADLKAQALSMGYRLSRIPQATPKSSSPVLEPTATPEGVAVEPLDLISGEPIF